MRSGVSIRRSSTSRAVASEAKGPIVRRGQTTRETSVVDVSLLAVGAWANQSSVNLAMLYGCPLPKFDQRMQAPGNPLTGAYRCSDGRFIQLSMLQPTRYWTPV